MEPEKLRVLQSDPSPFTYPAGPVGALLLHGFGGTAREMQPLGEYLAQCGITVHAPLLPGHGGTVADINRSTWHDWTRAVAQAYGRLCEQVEQAFVAGFSMGSLLALWLARQPFAQISEGKLRGLVLYSPALKLADWRIRLTPLARWFIQSIPTAREEDELFDPKAETWLGGYAEQPVPAAAQLWRMRCAVMQQLEQVQVPVLIVYSTQDQAIHKTSGPETIQRLSKVVPVESLVLEASGHAVVVDQEWEKVAEATCSFIHRHSTQGAAPGEPE